MDKLDSETVLANYDKAGMLGILDGFPRQCQEAIKLGNNFDLRLPYGIKQVVICGMGGSAMAGEVARRFSQLPLFVNRSHDLPPFTDGHTLLIAVSYSGNTTETISALKSGIEKGVFAVCLSSGGEIGRIANAHGLPLLKIPAGYQPRAALGYLAISLVTTLIEAQILTDIGRREALFSELDKVRTQCTHAVGATTNPAKNLARHLFGKFPLVYGTVNNTDLVAMRWKTQINENAKQPAFWNAFPELNHNEILSMVKKEYAHRLFVILLENHYDKRANLLRMHIMQSLLKDHSVGFRRVTTSGETELVQLISQIYFGDYVSFYLALLNQVDPTPVTLIEEFKKELLLRQSTSIRHTRQ